MYTCIICVKIVYDEWLIVIEKLDNSKSEARRERDKILGYNTTLESRLSGLKVGMGHTN